MDIRNNKIRPKYFRVMTRGSIDEHCTCGDWGRGCCGGPRLPPEMYQEYREVEGRGKAGRFDNWKKYSKELKNYFITHTV